MTTELLGEPRATDAGRPAAGRPAAEAEAQTDRRILGLRCRACGRPEPLGPSYVCAGCFGPLEVAYDLDVVRSVLSRATIEARPAGIWRYLELLPVATRPARALPVGEVLTTLVATHPGLGGQLFTADGDLNRFMNVFPNDIDIRHLQTLATPVSDRDAIVLLPAMAGGCLSAGGRSMDPSPTSKGASR